MSKTCWNDKLNSKLSHLHGKALEVDCSCSIKPCKLILVRGIEVISNHYNKRLESVRYISPQNMFLNILAVLLFSMQSLSGKDI